MVLTKVSSGMTNASSIFNG